MITSMVYHLPGQAHESKRTGNDSRPRSLMGLGATAPTHSAHEDMVRGTLSRFLAGLAAFRRFLRASGVAPACRRRARALIGELALVREPGVRGHPATVAFAIAIEHRRRGGSKSVRPGKRAQNPDRDGAPESCSGALSDQSVRKPSLALRPRNRSV